MLRYYQNTYYLTHLTVNPSKVEVYLQTINFMTHFINHSTAVACNVFCAGTGRSYSFFHAVLATIEPGVATSRMGRAVVQRLRVDPIPPARSEQTRAQLPRSFARALPGRCDSAAYGQTLSRLLPRRPRTGRTVHAYSRHTLRRRPRIAALTGPTGALTVCATARSSYLRGNRAGSPPPAEVGSRARATTPGATIGRRRQVQSRGLHV